MENLFTLESTKYNIKIENFEGPLDLLCHLIDVNQMDIYDISISQITDQYIAYLNKMKELDLEIASEFITMASTLLYLKSRKLLPDKNSEEEVISEEELINRIIKYKQYKDASEKFKEMYKENNCIVFGKVQEIPLPNLEFDEHYELNELVEKYKEIVARNGVRLNKNAKSIEKIAIIETYSIGDSIKTMYRALLKKPKFIFNKLFSIKKCTNEQMVTAFSGLLEMSRRNKVETKQADLFEDIYVTKKKI